MSNRARAVRRLQADKRWVKGQVQEQGQTLEGFRKLAEERDKQLQLDFPSKRDKK